jgi:predicted nucleic acid-binding protein
MNSIGEVLSRTDVQRGRRHTCGKGRWNYCGRQGSEIALPSVVVAEVLRGRCDSALKATPAEVPLAHRRLLDTQQMLSQFPVVVFDAACAAVMERLQRRHRRRKRYADLMIAAIVAAGQHILVTRNQADFRDVLPRAQLANWIDDPPEVSLP